MRGKKARQLRAQALEIQQGDTGSGYATFECRARRRPYWLDTKLRQDGLPTVIRGSEMSRLIVATGLRRVYQNLKRGVDNVILNPEKWELVEQV
jgi:hypothetical protein